MRACFDAVTVNNARDAGPGRLRPGAGCRADFVLLQARNPVEAMRLRAQRLLVVRGGAVVARMPPATATLQLPGRPAQRGFHADGAEAAGGRGAVR